jgi:hypothetical protein
MNCNEARQHWSLYHDSEGDAELHFQIGAHLGECPQCAEWFSQQGLLEHLLADKLGSQRPTPELWDQVLGRCGLARPARARRWVWLAGVAASVVLAVFVYWHWFRVSPGPNLAELTAAWHQRLTEGGEPVQFHSESDLEVERYLRKQVSFPVRCPPRKDAGFAVHGAGVCRLADQPAAYLAGNVDERPVSIFVLPRDSLAVFPHQQAALRKQSQHQCREGRYEMVMAVIDRNAVLVIGEAKTERLAKVLKAYGTYPDH